ncbi:MAG: hypothetical protein WAN36_05650 [Calditrichia bacterium]
MIRRNPYHPVGYFYKGAALQARMLDAEDYRQATEFYTLMDKTISTADSLLQQDPDNAWVLFYKGSAFLYRSYMKAKENDWLPAYRDALKGVGSLETAVECDSLLYDAYLGVGSFKYWKSARTEFLNWLPIIKDEQEKGIRMVRTAVEQGIFVHWIARDQLCWILLDDGQLEEALQIAGENAEAFPQSRFFKWTLVSALERTGRSEEAYQQYQDLLQQVRSLPQNNGYNEIECLVSMAEIQFKKENYHLAFQHADEALRLRLPQQVRSRVRKKLQKALDIRSSSAEYLP